MTTTPSIASRAALAAAALFGGLDAAQAVPTQAATFCRPAGLVSNTGAFDGLVRSSWGVRNSSSTGYLPVLCPVVRTMEVPSGSALYVWVDGNAAGKSVSCTLYSYAYTGVLMGSSSINGSGIFDGYLSLPSSQVPMFSSQVVSCMLPPNAALFDIEPTVW
ncbi:MAG: hypothetical protein JSR59_25830 [Proteobacteria bacterium]|nr:hypothetical protein [Pseudomonadota bacterium]